MKPRTPITAARRAFSLVELAIVVTILGIVTATAVPSLAWLRDEREAAAAEAITQALTHARTHAMMVGAPAGVRFDPATGNCQLVTYNIATSSIMNMIDDAEDDIAPINLANEFAGTTISAITDTSGANPGAAQSIVWFGFDGQPEIRDASGQLTGPATSDATITLASGQVVTVRRISGLIE